MTSAPSGKFINRFLTALRFLAVATDRALAPFRFTMSCARGFARFRTARRHSRHSPERACSKTHDTRRLRTFLSVRRRVADRA